MTRKQYKNVYEHYKFTTLWILFTFHHELSADVVPLLFHGDSDWIGGIRRNNTPLKSHHRNSRSLKVVFCAFQPRGFTLSKRPKDLLGSRDDSQVNPGNVVNGEPESRRFLLDMHREIWLVGINIFTMDTNCFSTILSGWESSKCALCQT